MKVIIEFDESQFCYMLEALELVMVLRHTIRRIEPDEHPDH